MNSIAIQVQDRGVITIPKKLRELWGIGKGDLLNITIGKDNQAVVEPLETIDKGILEASQKALQELREGKVAGPFANMSEFKEYLKQR
jgi:AbrB family looped-hinge helix DNA binding protein